MKVQVPIVRHKANVERQEESKKEQSERWNEGPYQAIVTTNASTIVTTTHWPSHPEYRTEQYTPGDTEIHNRKYIRVVHGHTILGIQVS